MTSTASREAAKTMISENELKRRVVHCMRDPYDVYIGRGRDPKTGKAGRWGNPFTHKPGTIARYRVKDVDEAISRYRSWLFQQIKNGQISLEELAALDDKVLGCWCAPGKCHGEILIRAARWAKLKLAE